MEIKNLKVNKKLLQAKALGVSFALMLTPISLTGCNKKYSETTIEQTIEQNQLNTYMGDIFAINKDLKKDVTNLEKALANNPEDEDSKKYIIDNSKTILKAYLMLLIKSTMCEANNESIYECGDYIINCQYDKYDGYRTIISKDNELYLIKDSKFKVLFQDLLNVLNIDENTSYKKIREIDTTAIENTKEFISDYDLVITEPNFVTSYFNSNIDEVVKTKKRK